MIYSKGGRGGFGISLDRERERDDGSEIHNIQLICHNVQLSLMEHRCNMIYSKGGRGGFGISLINYITNNTY